MGCCLSKTQDLNPDPKSNPSASSQFHSSNQHPLPESNPHPLRSPLSPVFEEESVKEVLSETPKPKPKPQEVIPIQESDKKSEQDDKQIHTKTEEKDIQIPIPKIVEVVNNSVNNVAVSEDFSEVSEICSLSGSISTTVTERKDDEDGEVSQPRVHRSPAKRIRKRPIPGEFVSRQDRGSKSPARRLNPSPGRRNDSSSHQNQNHQDAVAARRRIAENNRARRENIDRGVSRRSRSPATRTNAGTNRAGIGRSPSKRAPAPRSPARTPAVKQPEKVEEGEKETNELIENPLVSMECFIFL